ncbi:DUF6308 family protein [Amycolatopsis sp. CB00013]|uniref:DUF6308 family protein n=1 Tax=Amycolatopsis sp. CB00013 TaxID=1703945 RepID=UPI0009FA0A10|nr:DUF6308 family protein [Amycolatopsis sp. CB00013]
MTTAQRPPDPASYRGQHDLLDSFVLGEGRSDSLNALRRYFNEDATTGRLYTGRGFERLEGGGDLPHVRNCITSADVLALSYLSITHRLPDVAFDTMVTYADDIARLLAELPVDIDIHEAAWRVYATTSPAAELHALLRRCGGTNRWVTANKLLARKRPRLLPVYDSRVERLLGAPNSFWECLWTWFDGDPQRVDGLRSLRDEASGIEDISLLRCLDVVLWMRAAGSHIDTDEPG